MEILLFGNIENYAKTGRFDCEVIREMNMDEGMMILLYVLCIIVGLVISYFIAKEFKEIAELKGHGGGRYFWFTFLFGIVGMLMVIALPDERSKKINQTVIHEIEDNNDVVKRFLEVETKDIQTTQQTHKWLCNSCGKMRTQSPCEFCGAE